MMLINKEKKVSVRNKKITVIGLGLSGFEVAKLANYLGARVFVSDSGSSERVCSHAMHLMHENHIANETGTHTDLIYESDLWIVSPGVSNKSKIILNAIERNIPIVGEIEFASWFTDSPVIAITGSNGKTTTSYILSEMCKTDNLNGILAGNMGLPFSERVLNEIKNPNAKNVFIVECSSFQMEFLHHFSPNIALYTNISPDHLDRHGSMKKYLKMKLRISKKVDGEGFIVYNQDDIEISKKLKSLKNSVPFSAFSNDTKFRVIDNKIFGPSGSLLENVNNLGIPGEHNLSNFLAASTCAYLLGVSEDHIANVMKNFNGIEHRLEIVRSINDILFINDSKSTNLDSVKVAINSFEKPIILILGGLNKGSDFRLLLPHIKSSQVRDIVTYGDAGGHINIALGDAVRSAQVSDLNSAIKLAHSMAVPGDIILLSPGCASYDHFPNFEARGNFFRDKVHEINEND